MTASESLTCSGFEGSIRPLERSVRIFELASVELVFARRRGGRDREAPLPDIVTTALAEQLRTRPAVDVTLPWVEPGGKSRTAALIFVNREGADLSRAYYQHNAWKPALKAAGVEPGRRIGFHALRHHYASVLLEQGVSIRAVADYLDHHDPGFTLRTYAHLMPYAEDRTRQAIDAAFTAAAEPVRNEAEAQA